MKVLAVFLLFSTFLAGQTGPEVRSVLQRGEKLVAANQLTAAEDLYEKALHDSPDDPDLRYELAMVFFREHNWPKAIENYKSSLSVRPAQIKPLFYLAESYFMASDLDRARQTIAQAASIAPDDAQVCQKYGEYLSTTLETRNQGLAWLQKASHLNPALTRIDFEIGKVEFELTDYPRAAASLETALKKNAGDGEAAFYLAESWANLGEWSKARDDYSYALTHQYATGPVYYGLGRASVEFAEFEAAIDSLQRAIAMQHSLINAHFQLAKAYRQLGRTKDAEKESTLFTAMTDRVDTSRGLNGADQEQAWKQVKPLLEANQEQEALETLAKLHVAEASDPGRSLYLLGIMYFSMERSQDAKRVLAIAQTKSPQSAAVAGYLGMVRLSGGEVAGAEESFKSALAIDSSEPLALIGMGGIRYQQQRWKESIEYLEKSRTADPDALFMLCDAYYRVGKPEQAALTAEVIRALGAGRERLLDQLERLVSQHQKDQPHTP
ncbi:MAG TPA: tetratricopeptide repeat protein [Candidatus Sulfotelmatobacter sp.]|nr:tetratricopeptide repeat protein [Candidatus Sulfotelmatobacter sp.]